MSYLTNTSYQQSHASADAEEALAVDSDNGTKESQESTKQI
jgi:hypothetical protein